MNEGDRTFMKLIDMMISDLKVDHYRPEEVVIMQSDDIRDANGDLIYDVANFYIIIAGDFKVKSLKFIQKHHLKAGMEPKNFVHSMLMKNSQNDHN